MWLVGVKRSFSSSLACSPVLLQQHKRCVGTLLLAEAKHDGSDISSSTLNTLSAAAALGQPITALIAGKDTQALVGAASKLPGVAKVLVAQDPSLGQHLAEPLAALVQALQSVLKFDYIVAPSTSWGKGVLPRAAALLGVQPVSDVVRVVDPTTFVRPIYAGNALATVKYAQPGLHMLSVRPSAFQPPAAPSSGSAPVESVPADALSAAAAWATSGATQLLSRESVQSARPELASAKVVVAGGRALKTADNFKMLESLADALGGAVGASRAAVDAGMVPNDLQIGQTGKVIAPDLYIGIGISGAIQHVAGIKDAKTIVAINNNQEAEIFNVADYGLVADLFEAIPELEKEVRKLKGINPT